MYIYRCNKRLKLKGGKQCNTRVSLKRLVEKYTYKRRCPNCGTELVYRDRAREKAHKKEKCGCDGYHFPHRKGSKWCVENRANLTDKDYEERYK